MVLFPVGAGSDRAPTEAQKRRVLAAGRELKAKTDFVIGVSPWGFSAEQAFLPQAQGVFACLFGGGDGPPFACSLTANAPGTLWLRPENRGRAVTALNLIAIPRGGAPLRWSEGVSFTATLDYLSSKYQSNRAMEAITGKGQSSDK